MTDVPSGSEVVLRAVPDLAIAAPGDDPAELIACALQAGGLELRPGDILVVASKLISRAEGRFIDLTTVQPRPEAVELAARVDKDPRLVELVLQESTAVSRAVRGVLIVRHRLGFVSANAGLDQSNAMPPDAPEGSGPWVLMLPESPDASASRLRARLAELTGVEVGVVVSDSLGRPFRLGTVGAALGVCGLPALCDHRGRPDIFGRPLEHTETALADQIAAAADLVCGQGDERRAAVLVRGLAVPAGSGRASDLQRPAEQDLYA